jgi:Na+-translocating ferredoxin:NAD+ oxidoreductase RnfG subunit
LAFYLGLVLGLATVVAAGTVALVYLFTGKLISIEAAEGKPEVTLMTPDEVVSMMREQVKKAAAEDTAGAVEIEIPGGESDV